MITSYTAPERLAPVASPQLAFTRAATPAATYDTEGLYRDYAGKVRGWARRLVRSSTDAEDIVQEVFLTVHRRRDSLDCLRSPTAWLLKVTFNVARHVWRKRGHSIQELSMELYSAASLEPSPLEQLETRRTVQQFEAALDSLDERSREIYWLCEIQQLPSATVAAQTGVHPATFRVRRFRVRALIARKMLQQ